MDRMSRSEGMSKLTVGEKIYKLRKYNKTPQIVLAEIMRVRPDRIVRVERGEAEYSEAHINAAKEHFDIVGLPLTEQECITFRERLYYWRSLLKLGRLDDAEVIHKEVAKIDNLEPCDFYLVMLSKMMKVRHLIVIGKLESAEKILNDCQSLLPEMSVECAFHYYFNKGILSCSRGQNGYEEGLGFYLEAYEVLKNLESIFPDGDAGLYHNIASCYSFLEIPYRALFFLLKARRALEKNDVISSKLDLDRAFAFHYIQTNQLKEAEELLNKCLMKAEVFKDDTYIGYTLFYFGLASKRAENWKIAVGYFEEALKHFSIGTNNYNASVYHKIYCTIRAKSFVKATQLLDQAKLMSSASEMWAVYFKALRHHLKISSNMSTFNNDDAIEYIENIAIPRFIKEHEYFIAIDFYSLLEQHYEKLKSAKKSLLMAKAIRGIYERCYVYHGRNE